MVSRRRIAFAALAALSAGLAGSRGQAHAVSVRPSVAPAATAPSFSLNPIGGPSGTLIAVDSVTTCGTAPYSGWKVTITLSLPSRSDAMGRSSQTVAVDSQGAWSAQVKTPFGGLAGTAQVDAVCRGPSNQTIAYGPDRFSVTTDAAGYWLVGRNGFRSVDCSCGTGATTNIAAFGDAPFSGPMPASSALVRAVGVAANPSTGRGYWVASDDGGVFSFGDAPFLGSANGMHLARPVVGIASAPGCCGYWLAGADGGVFAFHTHFYGTAATLRLRAPIVGIAATSDGNGYWLVAADGGVFTFGDAPYYGSAANLHLRAPIVGIAPSHGAGYWLVAADGGVFTFGDAPYYGSAADLHLRAPVVGISRTLDGRGYWLAGADGGVFTFGDARYFGSCASCGSNFVAFAATPATYDIAP